MQISQSISGFLTAYDFETITVSTTVKQLTAAKYIPTATRADKDLGKARMAFMTVEGADVRYTIDGTTPAAGATGHLLQNGSTLTLANYLAIVNFKSIRNASTDAKLQVTYMR